MGNRHRQNRHLRPGRRGCGLIRDVLASLYDSNVANATTIQYGGSMNAKNAEELLSRLTLTAAYRRSVVKSPDFAAIIHAACI